MLQTLSIIWQLIGNHCYLLNAIPAKTRKYAHACDMHVYPMHGSAVLYRDEAECVCSWAAEFKACHPACHFACRFECSALQDSAHGIPAKRSYYAPQPDYGDVYGPLEIILEIENSSVLF